MKTKRIILVVALAALIVSMVPSVFACRCIDRYTPGYWKHNVRVYVKEKGSYAADYDRVKESDASMGQYEAWIIAHIDSSFTLEDANDDFWARGSGVQARRQQLANWFNWAKAFS